MRHSHVVRSATTVAVLWATYAVAVDRGDATLEELDQQVRILDRKLELADEAAKQAASAAAVVTAGKDGFTLSSADKAYLLRLRGYIQADARFFLDDDAEQASDTFLLRRVRPILEGKLGPEVGFRIMPDFGGGKSELTDAYIDYKPATYANLRGGKFKPPFGLERLQSGTDTRFIERGHPTSLAPNRDVGLELSGELVDGLLTYAVGAFNGVPDGGSADGDVSDGKDLVARLFAHPFKRAGVDPLAGLGLGVALSLGEAGGSTRNPALPSYKTPGQQTFFSYRSSTTNETDNVYADGDRVRVAPQACYTWGPLAVLGEYTLASEGVQRRADAATLDQQAWQVLAAYVLTGEDNSFKGVKPDYPFDPRAGHWGAWELVGRATGLDVDDAAFPRYADAAKSASSVLTVGTGLNWYLNGNVKVSLDYERSDFRGGAAKGSDRPTEHALLARWQLAF